VIVSDVATDGADDEPAVIAGITTVPFAKTHVLLAGAPSQENVTVPWKPLSGEMETGVENDCPWTTEMLVGRPNVKSGDPDNCTVSVTGTDAAAR
jgi:hypothetical protein